MKQWAAVLACVATLAFGVTRTTRAADDGQKVEQLQKQLDDLQAQLAATKQAVEDAKLSPSQHRNMMQHMGMMQQGWQGMRGQCCMMNPAGCAHMNGTPPKP